MKLKFISLMFAILLLSISGVLGANNVTLDNPPTNEIISGTAYILNASLDTNTLNMTNATFYYKLSGGSWVEIGSNINSSLTEFNTTFDTTSIVDAIGITFKAIIRNESINITEDTSTTVSIHNGVPTATWSSASVSNNGHIYPETSFTMGLDADSTIGIENCTFYFGTSTSSVTATGEACSLTLSADDNFTSFAQDNSYSTIITARDANGNETNSSTRTIYLDARRTGGSTVSQDPQQDDDEVIDDIAPTVTIPTKENVVITFFKNTGTFFKDGFTTIVDFFKGLFS